MYYFITLEQIKEFFMTINIDLSVMSAFEEACLFILANAFVLLFIIFVLSFLYKLVCRIGNILF